MQARERERLMKRYNQYGGHEVSPVACVATCAAGLFVIALVAAIGQPVGERDGGQLAQDARDGQTRLQGEQKAPQPEPAAHELQKASLR
jgi:hypothetical protein